jgi:hypothetical protein
MTPEHLEHALIAHSDGDAGPGPIVRKKCDACEGLGRLFEPRDVGRRIAAWRTRLGMKKPAMAEALGVSRVHYHNLEIGERHWHTSRIVEAVRVLETEQDRQRALRGEPTPTQGRRKARPRA